MYLIPGNQRRSGVPQKCSCSEGTDDSGEVAVSQITSVQQCQGPVNFHQDAFWWVRRPRQPSVPCSQSSAFFEPASGQCSDEQRWKKWVLHSRILPSPLSQCPSVQNKRLLLFIIFWEKEISTTQKWGCVRDERAEKLTSHDPNFQTTAADFLFSMRRLKSVSPWVYFIWFYFL